MYMFVNIKAAFNRSIYIKAVAIQFTGFAY